jgi:hypothetical protein
MRSIDICYIISHGFTLRMVTQTNLLGKLREKGLNIAVICSDRFDPYLRKYCFDNTIELFEFKETNKLRKQTYLNKRKYFLEDLDKNPALLEKHKKDVLYNKSRNPINHILPRYYYIIYKLIKIFPAIRKIFLKNESRNLHSKSAEELLKKIQPKKLVSMYPVNPLESTLLKAGNELDEIETWIHLLSWDNISCKGHFPQLANKYIVWGDIMKEELIEYYNIDPIFIFKCGVPHFDLYNQISDLEVKNVMSNLGIHKEDSILLFAMSSPRFAPLEIEIVEQLAKKVSCNEFNSDCVLIIRPHPQNMTKSMGDMSWIDRLDNLNKYERVFVDYPQLNKSNLAWSMREDDMKRIAAFVKSSAIVINTCSTISIEGLLCNKPVILSAFDSNKHLKYWISARRMIDYNHLDKLISLGGVTVAKNYEEFYKSIEEYLSNKDFNQENRNLTVNRQIINSSNYTNEIVSVLSLK